MQFYYVSHFLQIWLLPPGINLLLAVSGFLFLRHSQRVGRGLITIAFVSLWLLSTPIIAQILIDRLQYQYPLLQIDKSPKQNTSGAIIVLGGGDGIASEYENSHILSEATQSRLHYAAYLYNKTHLRIIVSGGNLNKSFPTGADLMLRELRNYFKIPVAWKEDASITTKDEGNLMVPILQRNGIDIAYLVTNAWHIPRAMYTFNSSFSNTKIKIVAAPMGYIILQPNQGFLNYLPSLEGLNTSNIAIHEYIGMLSYQLSNFLTLQRIVHYYVKLLKSIPHCKSVEDYKKLFPWNMKLDYVRLA